MSFELVYGKLQTLFSFTCDLIGFFTQAQWEVHVSDNFKSELSKFQGRTSNGTFYSCVLSCQGHIRKQIAIALLMICIHDFAFMISHSFF